MIEIRQTEGKLDNAGELAILTTENDRMLIRSAVVWTLECYQRGFLRMTAEELTDLVEFNNRFSEEVEKHCG